MYKYKKTKERINKQIDILDLQIELMEETYDIISESFEFQFVDENAFEQIIFLIVCKKKFELNNNEIEEIFMIMDVDEDVFLETIRDLFYMYETNIPETLEDVIEELSKLLL